MVLTKTGKTTFKTSIFIVDFITLIVLP